jgi:amino acid transporter
MRQARRDGFPLSWGMTSPALLYGCTGTWLNAPVPQTPIWAFIVVFVLINTFITGGDITVTARTNFVLLGLELVALTVFIAIKYVFIDGGGVGGLSLDPIYQPGNVDLCFIAAATSIAVLSFLGFDGISTLAEEAERPERTVGNATVAALLGFLTIFYVWFNFDVGTFLFGTLWLAAGIIIGAVKTKGFGEKPAVIREL